MRGFQSTLKRELQLHAPERGAVQQSAGQFILPAGLAQQRDAVVKVMLGLGVWRPVAAWDFGKAKLPLSLVDGRGRLGGSLALTSVSRGKRKGSGPIDRNGPKGASHQLDLTPFSDSVVIESCFRQ